jgi:putative ABC transport system substrate-binding protein
MERLPKLAAEVVALNPDVIVTASSAAVAACKKATSSIPIVFATAADPVAQGFASSLQRPGGNVTGVVAWQLYPKLAELAREAFPAANRLAILVHERDAFHTNVIAQFEPSARRLKFEPLVVRVANAEALQGAFEELSARKADVAIVPTLALFTTHQKQVIAFGLKTKLPLISPHDNFARAGGLLSYGSPREEHYRRAAALVDKILRGAKAGDLAIEHPERIELVVNRRTARAIGVKLSPVTTLRADRIID